jgi:DNA-directed RNA polymerase specialized sigma24 family protein
MSIIPETVYQAVEKKLRQRGKTLRRAEEALARARARATDISAPAGAGGGGKGGMPGSRTERGALAVIRAEKRMEKALAWERIWKQMDRIFPTDTNEGYVAGMIYGNGLSQAELARISGCSRQTVKLRQDRYIIRAAFLAAQAGLIREEVMGRGQAYQTDGCAEED